MSTKTTNTKSSENGAAKKDKNGNDALLQRVAQLESELESTAMNSYMKNAVNSGWASIEFTPDGIIQEVNDNWVNTLGYTEKEMVGQHHRMFCDPEYAKSAEYKKFWKDLADGKINSGEFKRYKKGGEPFYINASYTPIKDDHGTVVRVIKIAADITKMVELRDQGEAIKAAVDTGWASIEFTPDGIIQAANENFLSTTGYKEEEIIGQHHRMFCEQEYANSASYADFWKLLAKGETNAGEFKRLTKNGDQIYLQASYTPIKNKNGEVVKVIKIATEVTEQKKRNADYVGQIEAVKKAQAVIEFNLDGTIIDANENFLNAVGYKLSEIKGKHHKIFCDAEFSSSNAYKEFWASLNRGEYTNGEFERYDKNGNSLWLQANYNPIMDLNGNPFKVVKYATNITAQKQAMHELRRVIRVVIDEGNLRERADVSSATGAELELLKSINNLLEGIATPVLEVSEIISALANGDLTQEVKLDSKGDIRSMAEGLSSAMLNLNNLLLDINESSTLLASSSEQMLTKSDQMQGTTQEVASAIGQMAEGVQDQARQIDESSKLIEAVRQASEKMAGQAETINVAANTGQSNAKRGMNTIQKVVESMSQIEGSANITSQSIDVLTQRSEEIARTLNVITDIAGQTNLLALNAAIEAARAGDAGRGFAVVAEEIRKLAEDSRTSAGDIETVIKAVEKDISQAGKAIQEMGNSVSSGNDASKEAESVFIEIDQSISETLGLSEEVLGATEDQKSGIEETVKNIEKIVIVSEETSSGTEEIATSSKDLSNGMTEFNSSSKGLADIANQLQQGVSKFKLRASA
ncbi:PAS domain S-box protein [Reichenbachiella sp.]|uniref:methyl-accepting chemotaxis protein n=1 Tax=Reichenbachiella sp. TaxID=2184521 RepID=UPI003BB15879